MTYFLGVKPVAYGGGLLGASVLVLGVKLPRES
jgi:hypothetical protein